MKHKSLFVVFGLLLALLLTDYYHFREHRQKVDAFTVSEEFFRKGVLGDLLKNNDMIQASSGTEHFARNDLCADADSTKGYDYHNTYRLRFKIQTNAHENLKLLIYFPKTKRYVEQRDIIRLEPGKRFYTTDFIAFKDLDFHITLEKTHRFLPDHGAEVILSDIVVDGRYGRTQVLLKEGKAVRGKFGRELNIKASTVNDEIQGVHLDSSVETITYSILGGLGDDLYSGVFPGKKNNGFCRFEVFKPLPLKPVEQNAVPTIHLQVDKSYLYGKNGIIDNKQGKGRAWEVPAQYDIQSGRHVVQQPIGLRFHGGTPGRKKNIESFRINARNAYGKSIIDPEPLFGKARAKGVKGVVFKYTYQAYDLRKTRYNPYNYAFALDIGDAVGALVPAHQLVDLNINDTSYGLYLAMEHLSARSVKNWLDKDDLEVYTYKKFNNVGEQTALLFPLQHILKFKGEEAYQVMLKSYDVNNVINSVMLSAFIADDDYCQGVDIVEKHGPEQTDRTVTSVNWDLDHAFLSFKTGRYEMPAERVGLASGFDILEQNKPYNRSLCQRKWMISHVYAESKEFRIKVRDRLESLIQNELKIENIEAMLNKYRKIDNVYYDGEHKQVIDDMLTFFEQRPAILLRRLAEIEQWVESEDYKPNL